MKSIFLTYLILIVCSLGLNGKVMGMSFVILAENEKLVCENDFFPDGLTWFFERVGKYGENSEFMQTQELLKINLDIFNTEKFEYDDEGNEIYNWLEIDSVIELINRLVKKIDQTPDFHKKIIYDTQYNSYAEWRSESDSLFEIIHENNAKKEQGLISEEEYEAVVMKNIPRGTEYPIVNDYLIKGDFRDDLIELIRVLNCYKKNDVGKICFIYM